MPVLFRVVLCVSLVLLDQVSLIPAESIAPEAPTLMDADVCVAPGGDDLNVGTKGRPLKSFDLALEGIQSGCAIWLLPCEYVFTKTLQISKKKLGTATTPYRSSGVVAGTRLSLNLTGVNHTSPIRAIPWDGQCRHLHCLKVFGASDKFSPLSVLS
ncbi:MAG: hypothetical protein IT423_14130 [Pirellulaceae bacterium]|nr:hypothetical protein [Pirellulaceae bacterium]